MESAERTASLEYVFAPTRNGGLELGPRPPPFRSLHPDKLILIRRSHDDFLGVAVLFRGPQTKEEYDRSEDHVRRALARATSNPPPRPMDLVEYRRYEALAQEAQRRGITLDQDPGPVISRVPPSPERNPPRQKWQPQPLPDFSSKRDQEWRQFTEEGNHKKPHERLSQATASHMATFSASDTTLDPLSKQRLQQRDHYKQAQVAQDALKLKLAQDEAIARQRKYLDQVAKLPQYPGLLVASRLPEEAQNMQHVRQRTDGQRAASEASRQNLARNAASQKSDSGLEKLNKQDARIIEWYTSDESVDLHQLEEPKDDEWIDILRAVRLQPGCYVVARWPSAESLDRATRAVVVEWTNPEFREEFVNSPLSTPFFNAIKLYGLRSLFLVSPLGSPRRIVLADAFHDKQAKEIYEVCTAYFPSNISAATIRIVEWIDKPFEMPGGATNKPVIGALARSHGWADGEVQYQDQPARRMIYIFRWKDEATQKKYLDEVVWPTHMRDGRKLIKAMDNFVYELEDQGMLGFETRNFRLQGLLDWLPRVRSTFAF